MTWLVVLGLWTGSSVLLLAIAYVVHWLTPDDDGDSCAWNLDAVNAEPSRKKGRPAKRDRPLSLARAARGTQRRK